MTKSSSLTQSKRSGGPQSDEGKKVSSRNAIKTGAYSKAVILPGEDESEYRELEAQFIRDFAPRDIAEGAMVRELTVLTWKKIRLDQLEHRAVLQIFNKPLTTYDLGILFLSRPEAEWVMDSLDLLTEDYARECALNQNIALELLTGTVTPKILEGLKKRSPSLYQRLMQAAYEYEFEDYSHEALCEETIVDAGKHKNLMQHLLAGQVDIFEDIVWGFEHLEKIETAIQKARDERLITLMQHDKTSRAREDLSRSFFRTLSELRKHQHWRYQRDAVDVSPPVEEGE
jgi:hypothetical protein